MPLLDKVRRGRWYKSGNLLTIAANTAGTWQLVEGVFPFVIEVTGAFTATVNIYLSTSSTPPTDANANHKPVISYTGPDQYVIDYPVEYILVEVTGYSAGTVVVNGEASERSSAY